MAEIPINSEHANFKAGKSESQDDREHFVIRGHHLPNFMILEKGLLNNRFGPAVEAKGLTLSFKLFRLAKMKGNYPIEDMLGTTREDSKQFENDLKEQFKRFVDLPDDYPIKLTSRQKDEWCKIACIGEHCSKNFVKYDKVWVDQIIENSKELGVADRLKVSEEIANFSNTDTELVKEVHTTLGVLKDILRNSSFKAVKNKK